jgi:hypothetical protein
MAHSPAGARGTLYTIGRSTRAIQELVDVLRAHGIEQVVDVRTIPKSRHNPQFPQPPVRPASLAHALPQRFARLDSRTRLRRRTERDSATLPRHRPLDSARTCVAPGGLVPSPRLGKIWPRARRRRPPASGRDRDVRSAMDSLPAASCHTPDPASGRSALSPGSTPI